MEVITIDTRTAKQKFEDAKSEAKAKIHDALDWAVENKELVMAALPLATIGANGITKVVKSIAKNRNIKAEEALKKLYVYDRRNGMYLKLRKPLNEAQKSLIDQRRRNGETLTQILTSMRMLG